MQLPVSNNHFNPRPREGGDRGGVVRVKIRKVISIHAPREGGDATEVRASRGLPKFQSTPPARGATAGPIVQNHLHNISIHAPARGATVVHRTGYAIDGISIHAPREGGDSVAAFEIGGHNHFNPRPPRGGRLRFLGAENNLTVEAFQSTPPARGATTK